MPLPRHQMLQKRLFCTNLSKTGSPKWRVKQINKSNFSETLEEIKTHISESEYVAVSLRKTGSFSARWHRVLPLDTADTAYYKAKRAAERFQVLQMAVCPFSVRASKVVAHPYNFHLFPRDELKLGMPSYSFSCQPSYLTSMALEGFDFNACIYDGISYLSRAQESAAKGQRETSATSSQVIKSSSTVSVADLVFKEGIKSRVRNWRNMCKDSSRKTDEALVRSVGKILLGSEVYGSRPFTNVDVCSERQVQLVLKVLENLSDDLVPLIIPAKGGGPQAVRVVLTSSKEDKDIFKKELQDIEEEQSRKMHGFREVIDLISASQKPVVSCNSLNDLTFVHSKFLTPLPPSMDEFLRSLRSVFPHVLDINHLMTKISPLKTERSLPAAISYLEKRFFEPIDMDIPLEAAENEGQIHGHIVLRIVNLFAKLCSVLKIPLDARQPDNARLPSSLQGYTDNFNPCCGPSQESFDGELGVWAGGARKVCTDDLVFLWGFGDGISSGALKALLEGTHEIFSGEFGIRLVDRSCAAIAFWQPGASKTFLELMDGSEEGIRGPLREMASQGLRAAGYVTYKRACSLGLWETDLADSMDAASAEPDCPASDCEMKPSEIYWDRNSMIESDEP